MKYNPLKFPICEHCGKLGHNLHTCPVKNMIWVVKGTILQKLTLMDPRKFGYQRSLFEVVL